MLAATVKGRTEPAIPLSADDDRLLREAFGRFARRDRREAAAAIVRRLQTTGPGHWVLCDCLGDQASGYRPPALVLVNETHVRRHVDERWPQHADDCDFFRDPEEQRRITASYGKSDPGAPMHLIGAYRSDSPPRPPGLSGISHAHERPKLGRLLTRLVNEVGLQVLAPDWRPGPPGDQYQALKRAAREIRLAPDVSLSRFLHTHPPTLGSLIERVAKASPDYFGGRRPHGVFVVAATDIADGSIVAGPDLTFPVRGRIALFGETEGHGRIRTGDARRPPYLACCLVAVPQEGQPPELLRAYVHPVVSRSHLMLVDSDCERQTLRELLGVQRWLQERKGLQVSIEKPLFDIRQDVADETPNADSRPPCVPDFVVRVTAPDGRCAGAIVETMGYADAQYRERKDRMHPIMAEVLHLPVLTHDFHQPERRTREERDTAMRKHLIAQILRQFD